MKFLCGEYRENNKILGYVVFDSEKKQILKIGNFSILQNIEDYYGIERRKNQIKLVGYNFMPICNNQVDKGYYTLVGKFIEKKQKYYLLIRQDGFKFKYKEIDVLSLNSQNRITNTINSLSIVKLKKGSIPLYTQEKQKQDNIINDTVIKIMDMSELRQKIGSIGVGRKFLGVRKKDNRVGMVKYSIVPNKYDNINEVVCWELGKLFSVNVCEASFEVYKGDTNWVISIYEYIFNKEKIDRAKTVFGTQNFKKRFTIQNIKRLYGDKAVDSFNKMVLFDLLTHQTDRHINNFAFYKNDLYALYDNGRCLFWDVENLQEVQSEDIVCTFYTNEHGYGWSYVDGLLGQTECRRLLNQSVKYEEILNILKKYYAVKRANILANYIYKVYKILIGGDLNVG